MSIYFDNAATTPISTEAKAAMVEAMEIFGNPSSTHGEGRKAKAIIEIRSQSHRAALSIVCPAEIVFTSGGTEADNWALVDRACATWVFNTCTLPPLEHHAVSHLAEYCREESPRARCTTSPTMRKA